MLKEFSQILNKSFSTKEYQIGQDLNTLNLISSWEKIVGKKLVEVSLPQRISRKTLYIIVNHSAYANYLNQMAADILVRIESVFPQYKNKIESLRFIFSEKAFQKIEEKLIQFKSQEKKSIKEVINPHSPQFRRLEQEAQEMFSNLDDSEIKDSFISIYIQTHFKEGEQ